jgi:large subunit ribosomal protein L31
MKAEIHPEYFLDATTKCATCGSLFKVPATVKETNIEVCGNCHPFYTGNDRVLDTEGRVEKFRKRFKLEAK